MIAVVTRSGLTTRGPDLGPEDDDEDPVRNGDPPPDEGVPPTDAAMVDPAGVADETGTPRVGNKCSGAPGGEDKGQGGLEPDPAKALPPYNGPVDTSEADTTDEDVGRPARTWARPSHCGEECRSVRPKRGIRTYPE